MKLFGNRLDALVLAGITAVSSVAFAGAQARIVGLVTDGSGKPLEGVKITITTPAITTFKVEQKTDAKGKWALILNDSTVRYRYKYEKEGYMAKEEERKIGIGSTEEMTVQLLNQAQAVEKGILKETVDPYVTAYNDAVEKFKADDLDGALAAAQEAMKLGPTKEGAFDLAAKVAFKKKDYDKTIEWGEKSLHLEEDNESLFPLLAEAYRKKGNKEKVAFYEKKYASANPNQPDVLYNQAVSQFNAGKYAEAEPLLKKVVEAKPDYANAHYLLGMCYVNLNKIPDMKKHLNEYIKLDPKGKDVSSAKEMLDAFK